MYTQSPVCAAECGQALNQLVHVVEQRMLTTLTAALDGTVSQIGRVLSAEQKRTDFQPSEDAVMQLDQPTLPCAIVSGVMSQVGADAKRHLFASSRVSFLTEVSIRRQSLHHHQFIFIIFAFYILSPRKLQIFILLIFIESKFPV